jgi:hypothetical protein
LIWVDEEALAVSAEEVSVPAQASKRFLAVWAFAQLAYVDEVAG